MEDDGAKLFDLVKLLKGARQLGADAEYFAQENTPIGWTGQLRASIGAELPRIQGDSIIIALYAGATGKDGKPYAEKQHDLPLRHAKYQPFTLGFSDFADSVPVARPSSTASPAERKYWLGYRIARHRAPRFATKFLEVGAEQALDLGFENYIGGALNG